LLQRVEVAFELKLIGLSESQVLTLIPTKIIETPFQRI
jgi:hypothetical protein